MGRGLAPSQIKMIKFKIKLYFTSMTPIKMQASPCYEAMATLLVVQNYLTTGFLA